MPVVVCRAMSATDGQFVWFDLMTPDPEGSRDFYERLIGWTTSRSPAGDYEMWKASDRREVGGRIALQGRASDGSPARPYWLGYVTVESVDRTVERAPGLGGRVMISGTDIPNGGRFAVLADPLGALFAIHRPSTPSAPPDPSLPGHFGWAELNTTDWPRTLEFYGALFGWKPVGAQGLFGAFQGQPMGGMSNAAAAMERPAHWLHYITVANLPQTLTTVRDLAGRVLKGPTPAPGGGQMAQCEDPQGGLFALWEAEQRP